MRASRATMTDWERDQLDRLHREQARDLADELVARGELLAFEAGPLVLEEVNECRARALKLPPLEPPL